LSKNSCPAVQIRLKKFAERSDLVALFPHLTNDVAFRFWYNWYSSDVRAAIEEL
jgi:hypothetical protein